MTTLLTLGVLAQTVGKPDLSGTWQLDLQRTRFGDALQPKSLTIQIDHHEPQIQIVTVTTTEGGEVREAMELTTDGKPHGLISQGRECRSAAHWDDWNGTRLVVDLECAANSRSRRFALGTKGRILTTVLTTKDPSGEHKVYEFYFRQNDKGSGTSSTAARVRP
jgi:hypothetical protein